jgi:flagellar basal-body rod modification protein FlgD
MTTAVGATASDPYAGINGTGSSSTASSEAGSADRFLTLLVTQLQNQDPLNPMDNAQITSQMAQINAVTGLEKVNESVKALGPQILQMQALQGAALVGHDVSVEGDLVTVDDGVGRGAFELDASAGAVQVEVIDISGQVVDTLDLGPQQAGRHNFEWPVGSRSPTATYGFQVKATQGGTAISGRTLTLDRVQSVSATSSGLSLNLAHHGTVSMADVVGYN